MDNYTTPNRVCSMCNEPVSWEGDIWVCVTNGHAMRNCHIVNSKGQRIKQSRRPTSIKHAE